MLSRSRVLSSRYNVQRCFVLVCVCVCCMFIMIKVKWGLGPGCNPNSVSYICFWKIFFYPRNPSYTFPFSIACKCHQAFEYLVQLPLASSSGPTAFIFGSMPQTKMVPLFKHSWEHRMMYYHPCFSCLSYTILHECLKVEGMLYVCVRACL